MYIMCDNISHLSRFHRAIKNNESDTINQRVYEIPHSAKTLRSVLSSVITRRKYLWYYAIAPQIT